MSKRAAGVAFCGIAAFLFATRYLAAAIFSSGGSSWDKQLFQAMLEYVGTVPITLSIIALAFGVAYLIWGEYEEWTGRRR